MSNDNIRWPPGIKPPSEVQLRSQARKRSTEQVRCLNKCGRLATQLLNSFCSTTCAELYRQKQAATENSLRKASETSQEGNGPVP